MKNVQKKKEIKRRKIGRMNFKDRIVKVSKVQIRDQQVVALGRLIASSVLGVAKLIVKRTIVGILVHILVVVRRATK